MASLDPASKWRQMNSGCGLFQGSKSERELNYGAFPFPASAIDAMILTHAHIDHSGLVPKLVKHGFSGAIHASSATVDLCSVMLPDSAHIQELEVEQLNRRNAQRGRPAVTPIYTKEDAADCMLLFRPEEYKIWFTVAEGVRARFWNAGHLLGSASVELELRQARGGSTIGGARRDHQGHRCRRSAARPVICR